MNPRARRLLGARARKLHIASSSDKRIFAQKSNGGTAYGSQTHGWRTGRYQGASDAF